jgi:ornithine cyclodeaminase
MLILNRNDVARALDHATCIDVLDAVMRTVSAGDVEMPLRRYLEIPGTGGKFTLMPGYLGTPRTFGVKIVSKFPREAGSRHGTHVGAVMVFDAAEGLPLALMDGGELTAIRTSSASALATRALAREDAASLAILGAGEQARHHVAALLAVRSFRELRVWARRPEAARALAAHAQSEHGVEAAAMPTAEAAVRGSDVVTTVTSATEPVLEGAWLESGQHVNLVGAAVRTAAEADSEVVTRSTFFVDYRASAMDQAGELLGAIERGLVPADHVAAELGEVLAGAHPGRTGAGEITVYKSVGVSAQDLGAGLACYERARRSGIGIEVDW